MAYKRFAALMPDDSRAVEFKNFYEKVKPLAEDAQLYRLQSSPVNTSASEIAPNYFQQHFVFASNRDSNNVIRLTDLWTGRSFYDLYEQTDSASPAVRLKGKINSIFNDGPVCFYDNGKQMILTQTQRHRKGDDGILKLGLFHAVLDTVRREWTNIEPLTFNSSTYNVAHACLSADGNTLYFISDMPGGFGETDIYKSIKTGEVWSNPINLGEPVNTPGSEMFPFLENDSTVYFSSNTHLGLGGMDIYSAQLINEVWTMVQNLGSPVNSVADDFGYVSDSTAHKGFIVSNRTGGKGSDDIYNFTKTDKQVRLLVLDSKTNAPLENAIINLTSGNNEDLMVRTVIKGEFVLQLEQSRQYKIEIIKQGYTTYNDRFTAQTFASAQKIIRLTPSVHQEPEQGNGAIAKSVDSLRIVKYKKLIAIVEDLGYKPAQAATEDTVQSYYQNNLVFELPNIYFDLNSFKLTPLSEHELDNVAGVLKSFPGLVIEIGAHTDSRGKGVLNIILSTKRAEACVEYLISKGIDREHLRGIGYGESLILNKCKEGVQCTEAEHAVNRRIEFKVLRLE